MSVLAPDQLKPVQALALSFFWRHKRILLALPRQEGKTELGVRLLHDITGRPFTSSSLFVAKDRKSGKKATREKFMRLFSKDQFSVNTEQVSLRRCPTSAIYMDSADKEPDRMRGGTYSLIHGSEVAFCKMEHGVTITEIWTKIFQPTFRQTDGYGFFESTMNGKNGWYDLWCNAKDFGFQTLRISLTQMLYMGLISQEEYDGVVSTTHPDVFRQEYDCEFVTFQGRIYSEFDEKQHVWPDMPGPEEWQTVVSAIDWGFSPSATCALFAYVKDGVLCIFDELYAKEQLITQTADGIEDIKQRWGIMRLACVADHETDRIQELNLRGIACGLATKSNVRGVRIQGKELFHFKRILIHPRCKFLLRDLEAATWDPKKEGEIDYSQCSWGHFDAEAAFRYLLRELSEMETAQPLVNPHRTSGDPVSEMAWRLRNTETTDDFWGG
jgi:hypothetical protein